MWTGQEVSSALGLSEINHEIVFSEISIDSRTIRPGGLFLAINGNNFDGHDFIKDAIENGAYGLILEYIPNDLPSDIPFFLIENGLEALNKLAEFARKRSKAKVIAVTGSAGKTTTKEMLRSVLTDFAPTVWTQGNFNNHIGAPLSLSNLDGESLYGVFEIGTSYLGEIAPLSKMIKPDIAIITNIAEAHIGSIGSLELIAEEKSSIMSGLNKDGFVILNRDDKFFDFLQKKAAEYGIKNVITIGRHKDSYVRLIDHQVIEGGENSYVKAEIKGQNAEFGINFIGEHFVRNSLIVLAVASILELNMKKALRQLSKVMPLHGRGKRHLIKLPNLSFTFIDDAYNANPASMMASLKTLCATTTKGRRIAILGEMPELGEYGTKLHQEIGRFINTLNVDLVHTVGEKAKEILKVLEPSLQGHCFESLEDLEKGILKLLKNNDIVLLKGGNKMKLHKFVYFLLNEELSH